MVKLIILFIFLIILSSCGRGGNEENAIPAAVDMTQMPLEVSDPPLRMVTPLGWQTALATPQEGFTLTPQDITTIGVCANTIFILTVPTGNIGLWTDIVIDGQNAPIISTLENGTVKITPASAFEFNQLYTFRLTTSLVGELTWTFQTTPSFGLISTLPVHQSTNVPVNTGIELNFSLSGFDDVRPHFMIDPPVEGRFITRGATSIFMPTNPLAQGQVYTVTLTAGVGVGNQKISENIMFAFETATDTPINHQSPSESFHFSNVYAELPSFEPPQINFWLNYPTRNPRPRVDIEVFRFGEEERAVSAIHHFFTTPMWAWHSWQQNQINTINMQRVARMSFNDAQNIDEWGWSETLILPNALPAGFYIVNAIINSEISAQKILQITDIAVHLVADNDQTLVWVNDMVSGLPLENASVRDNARNGQTDVNGIVMLYGGINDADDRLIIEAPDGRRVIIFYARHIHPTGFFLGGVDWWNAPTSSADYWSVLQPDRTLFQRNDTLQFWGMAQHRTQQETINQVTAVITEGWSWARFDVGNTRDALHRQNFTANNGRFYGEIQLPYLERGWYVLTIYHGNTVLSVVNFEVDDFVKPPYQLIMEAYPRAIFMDEQTTFTIRTEFFEGTPVPDLQVAYSGWGWPVNFHQSHRNAVTDQQGEVSITFGPFNANANEQGQGQIELRAEAVLPEIGPTFTQYAVQIFLNDINVRVQASREGEHASIEIKAHHITLDRLNDGTAENSQDFLCRPLIQQNMAVDIVRVYWVAEREGERYCFINREVVPRYRHIRREEVIQNFTLTTNAQGEASRNFTVPNVSGESYFARVTTTDGNGRRVRHESFIGRDWWDFWSRAENGEPFLDGARPWNEGYDLGEEVHLTVMSGTEKLERGSFLFIIASGGIIEYRVGENPLVFTFDEAHLPVATVYAIHFNGHIYHSGWFMRETLRFNHASRALNITMQTCQTQYQPGEAATITIHVTDENNVPVEAFINIAAVDEALFALRDFTPDTLRDLYRHVPSGIVRQMVTHSTFHSDGHDWGFGVQTQSAGGRQMMRSSAIAEDAGAPMATPAPTAAGNMDAHIREIFEDTALFFSATTNAQGMASVTFRLPDNITSWRLTASGITESLYAGNGTLSLVVSNPLFVHYSLNNIFLIGDIPVLGVNAYGTAVTAGDRVIFDIWCGNDDFPPIRAEGYAFERMNIPLWELTTEGLHSLLISATAKNGLQDIIRHEYEVIASHRYIDVATFYDVTPGMVFEQNLAGMTQITFADRGQSQFLTTLMSVRHPRGARLEDLISRREANRLIHRYFPEMPLFMTVCNFEPSLYQQADGGLSILPHAGSSLSTTVAVMPFIADELNRTALRNYLYSAWEDPAQNSIIALYGLALLREPVLLHLHEYALIQDLPVMDAIYLALAFASLGDMVMARNLYDTQIMANIESIAPFYRIGGENQSQILQRTALAAILATKINAPEREGLFQYISRTRSTDPAVQLLQLAFITHEISRVNDVPASITYTLFGEEVTRDLTHFGGFTLRIPTQTLHEFSIISTTGDVGAVIINRVPLEEIETTDADVTITRQYFLAGEREPRTSFSEGDLIRVQLTINYGRTALTGAFQITDFLPAGLVFTPNSARAERHTPGRHIWATTEGQRIKFFDFHDPQSRRTEERGVYFYYARVINAGTFTAQGVVVQNLDAPGYMTVGECERIVIYHSQGSR